MKEEYPKAKAQINYKHQSKFIYRINTFILNAIFKKKKDIIEVLKFIG
jgi:hypothetical protein